VSLLRIESAADSLGGRAMLNALSTAMFALTLRLASEAPESPAGLLALAGHPRLAPALAALFHEPGRSWTLSELARLCHMSRATCAASQRDNQAATAVDRTREGPHYPSERTGWPVASATGLCHEPTSPLAAPDLSAASTDSSAGPRRSSRRSAPRTWFSNI
jgi:hypothetical protein